MWQLYGLLVNITRPLKLFIVNLEMFDKLSSGKITELLISFNFSGSCKNLNVHSFQYCWYFKISEFIKYLKALRFVKISFSLCPRSNLELFKLAKRSSKHSKSGAFRTHSLYFLICTFQSIACSILKCKVLWFWTFDPVMPYWMSILFLISNNYQ